MPHDRIATRSPSATSARPRAVAQARRQPRLGREISVLLVCKVLALIAVYALFFGPAERPRIDTARLFEPAASSPTTR